MFRKGIYFDQIQAILKYISKTYPKNVFNQNQSEIGKIRIENSFSIEQDPKRFSDWSGIVLIRLF